MPTLLLRVIMPLVSVIMSVYNGEEFLKRAMDSILTQTFTNFEFIIIDDGSSDNSLNILEEYAKNDNRIKIVSQKNIGLTKSLNIGIKLASGKYIARQDADDVSLSQRLEKQVDFLEKNEDIVLLGTNQYEIDGEVIYTGKYFDIETINKIVYLYNPIVHTSAMFRRDFCVDISLYDESFTTSQDFEAWMRLAKFGKIAMLDDILVKRYIGNESITATKKYKQVYNGYRARKKHNVALKSIVKYTLLHFIISSIPKSLIQFLKGKK